MSVIVIPTPMKVVVLVVAMFVVGAISVSTIILVMGAFLAVMTPLLVEIFTIFSRHSLPVFSIIFILFFLFLPFRIIVFPFVSFTGKCLRG